MAVLRKLLVFVLLVSGIQVFGQTDDQSDGQDAADRPGALQEPRSANCIAPIRPLDDQDDERWQNFLMRVDQFRDCVNRRVQWHQNAATMHSDRARQTALRWNDFVQSSLNAPADFPHPSDQR